MSGDKVVTVVAMVGAGAGRAQTIAQLPMPASGLVRQKNFSGVRGHRRLGVQEAPTSSPPLGEAGQSASFAYAKARLGAIPPLHYPSMWGLQHTHHPDASTLLVLSIFVASQFCGRFQNMTRQQ